MCVFDTIDRVQARIQDLREEGLSHSVQERLGGKNASIASGIY